MKIIGISILYEYKLKHTDCCGAINSWIKEAKNANWNTFHGIKQRYASASNLGDQIVIFNIKGNNCRLEAKVYYQKGVVLIKRIGTHAEYSKWH